MKHVAELASSGSEKATQEKLKILRQQKGPIPKVLANYKDDVFAVLFANILSRELKEQFKYQAQFQVNNNCKSGQNPSIDISECYTPYPHSPVPVQTSGPISS